jgi:hypothetical protein
MKSIDQPDMPLVRELLDEVDERIAEIQDQLAIANEEIRKAEIVERLAGRDAALRQTIGTRPYDDLLTQQPHYFRSRYEAVARAERLRACLQWFRVLRNALQAELDGLIRASDSPRSSQPTAD